MLQGLGSWESWEEGVPLTGLRLGQFREEERGKENFREKRSSGFQFRSGLVALRETWEQQSAVLRVVGGEFRRMVGE